jgi:hypothetical protein
LHTSTRNLFVALLLVMATCTSAFAASPQFQRLASGGLLIGTFSVNHITDPLDGFVDTDAFNTIQGRRIRFVIAFDSIDHQDYSANPDGGKKWILTTSPATVDFFGDPTGYLQNTIAPTLNCPLQIAIREDVDGTTFLDGFDISQAQAPQYFGFQCDGSIELTAGNRSVSVQSADLDANVLVLRRYLASLKMTDLATGWVRYDLFDNVPVAVEPKTISEVKSMYRTNE